MSYASTAVNTKTIIKTPSMWKVILHNDDYTPMEFVIEILRHVFNKPFEEAVEITMRVHEKGSALVGLYTKDIAQSKVTSVKSKADHFQHPLLATAEEA